MLAQTVKITSTRRAMTEQERAINARERDPGRTYWTVRLRYKGRRMSTPFHMGSAHKGEPEAANVLSCLISDNESVKNARGFAEWAADMGTDEDSREGERTYKACKTLGERVERLLGADYPAFRDAANDY